MSILAGLIFAKDKITFCHISRPIDLNIDTFTNQKEEQKSKPREMREFTRILVQLNWRKSENKNCACELRIVKIIT